MNPVAKSTKPRVSYLLSLALLVTAIDGANPFHAGHPGGRKGTGQTSQISESTTCGSTDLAPIQVVIDGIMVRICSPFDDPADFVVSAPDDLVQSLAAVRSQPPYLALTIETVRYGNALPIEGIASAQPGMAQAMTSQRLREMESSSDTQRISQATMRLMGSPISSLPRLDTYEFGGRAFQVRVDEWLVEEGGRLWIVRTVREALVATNSSGIDGLAIDIVSAAALPPAPPQQPEPSSQPGLSLVLPDSTAADVRFPEWWGGECNVNNHPGSNILAIYRGLRACGPGNSLVLRSFGVGVAQYEWQCTELSKRFLYLEYGVPPYSAHGKSVVSNFPFAAYPRFVRVTNGAAGSFPQPNDVISFGWSTSYGHTAIVTRSDVDSQGNGNIWIIEQNYSRAGTRSLRVTNWVVRDSMTVDSWLHDTQGTSPMPSPTPTPLPTSTLRGLKAFGTLLPWYYVISTSDDRVQSVYLNDRLLFTRPNCARALWVIGATHGIQFDYDNRGSSPPVIDIRGWPFVQPACAAAPLDPPPPTSSPPTARQDGAGFVADITIPDGTQVNTNQSLIKTWRLRNTGTVAWDASVKLAFRRGKQMGAPNEVGVAATAPGATADISVNLAAPGEPGEHAGYWQLKRGSTFFGPELSVQINVRGDAPAPNPATGITTFDVSPGSPSAASSVRLVGRVRQFADFRAMRFVAGNERFEMSNFRTVGDQFEISADWNTANLARGTYAIALEVARVGDTNWSQPIRQMKTYSLMWAPAPANRPPSRPVLKSPYNWFLQDASGASAAVTLCVEPASDPDGNEVRYIFQVNNGLVDRDYDLQPCWTYTYAPGNYFWRAKTRDSNGAESDWSAETWNFSVANGGVSIGTPYERVLDPGQTQLCVEVNYGGIQAPEVKGFINTATDGSESGEWRQLDHFGPNAEQCNAPNVHGFRLYPVSYATGLHAIKISAHKLDSGASAQRMTSFNVPFMRPPGPQGVAPSTPNNDGTQWNTRTILFNWEPALRAEGYILRVSTTPDPFGDPSPVLNVALGPNTTEYSHTFSQDYAALYWSVRASNGAGTGDSAIASFGIDLVQPNCAVQPLPAVHYDTVATVNWVGSDNASGVRSFDVQVRDSQRGDWLDWLVDSEAAVAQFLGQPGLSYEFRCRARDRAGNVGTFPANAQASTKLDPTARPPEPWWNGSYSGKRTLNILNSMPSAVLPAGYPVVLRAAGATAAEIYDASQSSPKCNDLRVVYNNATELDRLVTKCTSGEIEIWFRNQASIAPGGSSNAHQLYFGNPGAGSPPSQPTAVWYPTSDGDTVALYYFQEGSGAQAFDASGNNRTCSIDPSVQWAASKFGQGLRLNRANAGDSRSLNCGPAPALTSFSMDFWYKSDAEGDGRIAGALAGGGNGGGGNNWLLSNFEGRMRLDVWPCGPCGSSEVRSNFNLRDTQHIDKWHHIAVTFNGGNEVRFYLDGALDSVKMLSGNGLNQFSPPLEIGSVEGGGQLKGNLGAFRLSRVVRTDFGYGAFALVTPEPSLTLGSAVNPPANGSPDLAVLSLNAFPYANGTQLIEAVVRNQGTQPTLNNIYTDLYVNHVPSGKGDLTGSARFWINDSIAPGDIVTLTAVLDSLPGAATMDASATQESSATLYAQTDSSGGINEPNVADNIFGSGVPVCVTSNDAFEGDNSLAQAKDLGLGQTQTHNFASPGDEDWVRVELTAGQAYRIRTSGLGDSADTVLELYSAAGALLAANDDTTSGGGLASEIVYTAQTTGTHYARVRHWNSGAGGCGTSYTLSVQVSNPPPPEPKVRIYAPFVTR
jgi:hypothetical protein